MFLPSNLSMSMVAVAVFYVLNFVSAVNLLFFCAPNWNSQTHTQREIRKVSSMFLSFVELRSLLLLLLGVRSSFEWSRQLCESSTKNTSFSFSLALFNDLVDVRCLLLLMLLLRGLLHRINICLRSFYFHRLLFISFVCLFVARFFFELIELNVV